jgi:hypothetical protein
MAFLVSAVTLLLIPSSSGILIIRLCGTLSKVSNNQSVPYSDFFFLRLHSRSINSEISI